MTKIAFLPIDNRPVCYDLPQMIANLDFDNEFYLPDINLLGDLNKIGNIDAIFSWLESLPEIDVFVLSLDTIAYGGLVSSRRSCDDVFIIKSRINSLFNILKKTKAKVYAFSSIMRISNNNINEEEKEYWCDYGEKIFKYSYDLHRLNLANNELITDIPQYILDDYINTRKRNFEVNKYYIELKKQGLIDTLVFSKDDCAEFGWNVKEAEELDSLASDDRNILVKTGADEIPLTLLSRALNKDKEIKIAPVYTNIESIDKISKYEDVSVESSVKSQIELAGGICSDLENCDLILLVNNFKNQQGELVMDIFEPLFEGEIPKINKPFFVTDILNANGADNNFVVKLLEKDLKDFYGYSAWNTTGNTVGSAIAIALTSFASNSFNKDVFEKLQVVRFLDDWAYQANVRSKIRKDSINLTNDILCEKMKKYEDIILAKFNKKDLKIKYSYPWNRFFEVRIRF